VQRRRKQVFVTNCFIVCQKELVAVETRKKFGPGVLGLVGALVVMQQWRPGPWWEMWYPVA
jgi:hypothetical protein